MNRASLWRFLAIALPALAGLVAALPAVDLAFGLRAGQEILANGAVPTVDTWTFMAGGRPWIDQQWGAQVLLRIAFDAAGWTGLVVLRAALLAVAFGLLLAIVRVRAPRLGAIGSTLLVIAAFAVAADALALRAQLFAIVLFAATLLVLAVRDRWPRSVWLIPVFALAWANLHGTFLFAPALCGLAWLADLYDATGRGASGHGASGGAMGRGDAGHPWRVHEMLLVGLVATAATLVNPSGAAVWGYVANLTSNATIASRVSEWRPPSPLTIPGLLVWLSVVAVAALAWRRVRDALRAAPCAREDTAGPEDVASRAATPTVRIGAFRAPYTLPWPALLTLLLFGGFALTSGRGTAWWPFVAVFVVAPWLQPATARLPRPTPDGLRRINAGIAVGLVIVAIVLLPVWRPVGPGGVPSGVLTYAPGGISDQLNRATCLQGGPRGPKVWNPQVWGSWLEFASPCYQYATDSRIELFSAADWADVDAVEDAAPNWQQVLDERGVDLVVTARATDATLERALEQATGAWFRVYRDCDGSIWVRTTPGEPLGSTDVGCGS